MALGDSCRISDLKSGLAKLWHTSWFFEAGLGLPTAFTSAMTARKELKVAEPDWLAAGVYAGLCVLIGGLVCWRAIVRIRERDTSGPNDWLYPFLNYLHDTLLSDCTNEKHGLRICLHRSLPGKDLWEQLTEYVGDNSYGKAGRRFTRQKGILGLTLFAIGDVVKRHAKKNETTDQFLQELQIERHEVAQYRGESRSWAAICIGDDAEKLQVVIFCDAIAEKFFTKPRENALQIASLALARFVKSA